MDVLASNKHLALLKIMQRIQQGRAASTLTAALAFSESPLLDRRAHTLLAHPHLIITAKRKLDSTRAQATWLRCGAALSRAIPPPDTIRIVAMTTNTRASRRIHHDAHCALPTLPNAPLSDCSDSGSWRRLRGRSLCDHHHLFGRLQRRGVVALGLRLRRHRPGDARWVYMVLRGRGGRRSRGVLNRRLRRCYSDFCMFR